MKKISLVLACSALCAAAFAEADTITTASANTFGAVKIVSKVTGADNYTYVAVPFEEFPATGVEASSYKRLYNGIIIPGLCSGATMSIYDADGDVWQGYVSDGASWSAASAGAGNGGTTSDSPASDDNYANVGTGVFWNPGTKEGLAVYSYGQVPTGYTEPVSLPAGKTLVCPPGANALKPFNLNDATWNGVTTSTATFSSSGKVRKFGTAGDMIQFRDPATGLLKQFYYIIPNGESSGKWSVVAASKPVNGDSAVIPAGTAFWYVSKGSASVTWP